MSRKRLGRLQRVATIIPLALLSAAWTAGVAGVGGVSAPVLADESGGGPSSSVPEEAPKDPASYSDATQIEGLNGGNEAGIVSAASTNAIPAAALAAYQRAETVINSADESCNLPWQLVAAIGRVESNHGRFGGNVLNDDGVATPGIYGIPLNGTNNTAAISDTDAGIYDNDTEWDRAVGPMQFIPQTWQVVGVDADDDSARNPQDIDDAALAAAVYLCSGTDDLSTVVGQRASVYRYNHSQSYVDLVLKVMDAYLAGDFSSAPNNSTAAGYIVPEPPNFNVGGKKGNKGNASAGGSKGGTTTPGTTTPGTTPGTTDPGTTPGGGDGSGGGDSGTGNGGGGSNPPKVEIPKTGTPLDNVTKPVEDVVNGLVNGLLGPLKPVVARLQCATWSLTKALAPGGSVAANNKCLASYGLT